MTKTKVLEAISNMPDEFQLDEIIEKIIFIYKIEKGLLQSKTNQVLSSNEAKKRMEKWLK